MASMYEIEKMIEEIVRRTNLLAAAVGVDLTTPEPEAPVITEEQTDPDA